MARAVIQFLLVHLIVSGLLWREAERLPLERVDSWFIDWLAGNAPRERQPAPLLLVEINDATLQQIDLPLTPLDYSLFLQAVLPHEPSVIAVVPVMEWSGEEAAGSRQYLRVLQELIRRTPKIVLGARLGQRDDPDVIPPVERVPVLPNVRGATDGIPEYEIIARKPDDDLALAGSMGFANLRGTTSVAQRAPMVFRYRGMLLPSFTLQSAMLWMKLTPEEVVVVAGSHIEMGDKARIPIDRQGRMLVDFATPISRFGYDDLLLAVAQKEIEQLPFYSLDRTKNGVTVLARTDKASRTLMFPDGQAASIGELVAEAIATIQNGTFYRRVPRLFDLGLVIAMALIGCFFLRRSPQTIALVGLLMLVCYLFAAVSAFGTMRLWMPLALPTGLALFIVIYGFASPVRPARQKAPPGQRPSRELLRQGS